MKDKKRSNGKIDHWRAERSRIRIESQLGRVAAKLGEKDDIIDSDRWELVDSAEWLETEAQGYSARAYRSLKEDIQGCLEKAFSYSRHGTIAVLAIGLQLTRLKRNYRCLVSKKHEREWGERRRKIAVLKKYGVSEFLFDQHSDIRVCILGVLEGEIRETETSMRKVAKQFGIEIPVNPQDEFDFHTSQFESKIAEFKSQI